MSAYERKADLKRAASEFQFANVCFGAVSGPRSVTCLMSASSHKPTFEPANYMSELASASRVKIVLGCTHPLRVSTACTNPYVASDPH